MSEVVSPTEYPKLENQHLEIIPLFSNKLLYQNVPTQIPNLTLQEKSKFLAAVLNIFEKDDSNQETGFRIDYLENPAHQQVFKSIHKDFEWIQQNTYSLLAICNFLPQIFAPAQSPNTRATAQETRDAFIEVISKDEHKDLREIMNEANPEDQRESLDKFISLVHTISRSLFILIVKIHQAIVLNYHAFRLEASTLSLQSSYNELLLGISNKDLVLAQAKEIHEIRKLMNQAFIDYLGLRNPELDPFIQAVVPGLVFSNVFSFENYKSQLLAGDFGKTWHYQSVPLPMSEPKLRELSENLDNIITKISGYKASEAQVQEKISKNLKINIENQINKWKLAKEENKFTIPFLEVLLESYKSLKKEAIQMGTKIEWNEENLGISQNNLEEQIIEISQALSEARDLKRKNENNDKKISDSICSKGPDLKLPKINSPCDILLWVKSFKQMSAFIPSELTKIAIIKTSLIGKDKKAVEHLSGVKRKIEQEKSEMVVVKNKRKMNEKSDHQLKSESKSTDMSKQNLNLRIHDKVEICSPKLRHSESTADGKKLVDKSTEKNLKNVQKELNLRGKIKIWDKFFNEECTMTKNYCQIVKGGPGAKCMEFEAERQPNPTEIKNKKEGSCLRGQISMDVKRANK